MARAQGRSRGARVDASDRRSDAVCGWWTGSLNFQTSIEPVRSEARYERVHGRVDIDLLFPTSPQRAFCDVWVKFDSHGQNYSGYWTVYSKRSPLLRGDFYHLVILVSSQNRKGSSALRTIRQFAYSRCGIILGWGTNALFPENHCGIPLNFTHSIYKTSFSRKFSDMKGLKVRDRDIYFSIEIKSKNAPKTGIFT